MKDRMNLKYILLTITTSCIMISCGTDGDSLSPEEKYTADTIYSQQLNDWRKKLDSICSHQKDTLFVKAVDSLKKERMAEIEMLLMKNHSTQ
ncbi:MAG: hypothetical protein IPN89_15815 [Saprospiraceae bacterium]|nr:hypothetical protein [Saprospiraceae bacterium]